MDGTVEKRNWARPATRIALVLSLGAVAAALLAAFGAGRGIWHFRSAFMVLRYAFFVALAGGLVAIVAMLLARRARETGLMAANAIALLAALGFAAYLGGQYRTATSVPGIHDITTNLDDMPQFARLTVREDNLEKIPDEDKPEYKAMDPEMRWKALHRQAYGDIKTLKLALPPADAIRKAERLAKANGWEIARVDTDAGALEATATSTFFRFKDDVVVRARPAPGGGSEIDMRSISRVGVSDVGVNAKRVRGFLEAMQRD